MTSLDDSTTTASGTGDPPLRLVNGVFKGGGAKGVAYAGALTALRERGPWFRSVAGTSAGAITAALIASGMGPDELSAAVPEGLAATQAPLPARIGKAVIGHATSIFESKGLRAWIDRTLTEQIGKTDGTPVTFADLYAATGMELYVVAMDLANGLPVVFCRRTTPAVEVAGAVVSSSAIPGAFPPGRGVFGSDDEGAVVHQFADGGSWANYPAFVFQDQSFRAWLHAASRALGNWTEADDDAWEQENDRPLVGFILGDPAPLERRRALGFVPLHGRDVNRRFDRGPTYTSPKRGMYLFGAVLSSDWVRLFLGIAMAAWVSLSLVTLPIAVRRFSTWLAGWSPDVMYPILLVGTLSMVVLAAFVAIGLVAALVLVGRLIADTLVPTVTALVGVPTDVAPWVGMGNDCVVLKVPHEGIGTTQFAISDEARAAAVTAAHESVSRQLDEPVVQARLEALLAGTPVPAEELRLVAMPREVVASPNGVTIQGIAVAVAATALIGGLAWWGTNSAGIDDFWIVVVAVFVGFLGGGGALLYIGGRAGARAAGRSRFGIVAGTRVSGSAALAALVGGAALVGLGAVLSVIGMDDRNEHTREASVVSAQDTGTDQNEYVLRIDDATTDVTLRSARHLRLGEHVFVDLSDETPELVGPLDNGLFGVAVVCILLGLGLISSGVRRRNWDTRCARLDAVVTGWAPARPA